MEIDESRAGGGEVVVLAIPAVEATERVVLADGRNGAVVLADPAVGMREMVALTVTKGLADRRSGAEAVRLLG